MLPEPGSAAVGFPWEPKCRWVPARPRLVLVVPAAEGGACRGSHVPAPFPGWFGRRSEPGSQPLSPAPVLPVPPARPGPGKPASPLAPPRLEPRSCRLPWRLISTPGATRPHPRGFWERRRREDARGRGFVPLPVPRRQRTLSHPPRPALNAFAICITNQLLENPLITATEKYTAKPRSVPGSRRFLTRAAQTAWQRPGLVEGTML